mgnify:CR=1 FL=1
MIHPTVKDIWRTVIFTDFHWKEEDWILKRYVWKDISYVVFKYDNDPKHYSDYTAEMCKNKDLTFKT